MEASDVELVRMLIREALREEREYGAGLIVELNLDALRADVTRLADAVATLLPAPGGEEGTELGDELNADDDALEDELVDPAAVIIDDGDGLEELETVTEFTPQEAADEIAPLRTHPLLRRISFGAR